MTSMLSLLASLLVVAAALGAGALVLAATHTLNGRPTAERLAMAFALGTGVLGWLGFFAALGGLVDRLSLILICVAMAPGVILLKGRSAASPALRFDAWARILLAAIATVMVFNLLEGLSPPADADSLAYHFALPKLFLAKGRLVFVPRAADGAIPLLQQMTYMTALGIGGERALTLWSMFGGWGAAALVYAISRRHLDVNWSLVVALVFLTTPAVVYGAGNGQVEVTNAMFTLAAAVAVADALATGRIGYAVVAGLLAGFFAGSKYTGLAVAFSLGLTVLFQRRWLAHGAALSTAFLIAGGQWYAWNWWNTGDPLFPMLYGLVEYRKGFPWNQAQNTIFKNMMNNYRGVPANLWWLFLYPFKATLDPAPEFQSLRIGFGPYVLVMLPPAVVALPAISAIATASRIVIPLPTRAPSVSAISTAAPSEKPPLTLRTPTDNNEPPPWDSARVAPASIVILPSEGAPKAIHNLRAVRPWSRGSIQVPTVSPSTARTTVPSSWAPAMIVGMPDHAAICAAAIFVATPPVPNRPAFAAVRISSNTLSV